jgi:DNA-binding MarR family transcriptional regulator
MAEFGHSVGFLLSQLGFETARRFGLLMHEVDLEPRQFALLRAISATEGEAQNAVAERLRIPPSSMVAVIDLLEGRGLVERRAMPGDRRSRSLHLTEAGKKLLGRAVKLAMGFESIVCTGFTEASRKALIEDLSRVACNLDLQRGLHPDTSAGHGPPHWTDDRQAGVEPASSRPGSR